MTSRNEEKLPLVYARSAGIGLPIIFILGFFGLVVESLIEPGDLGITASNIASFESTIRISVVSWLIVLVAEVVVAWVPYVLLGPVNRNLSLLAFS